MVLEAGGGGGKTRKRPKPAPARPEGFYDATPQQVRAVQQTQPIQRHQVRGGGDVARNRPPRERPSRGGLMGLIEDVGLTPRQISASWRPATDWYQRWGSGLENTIRSAPQTFMDVGHSISGESPITPDKIAQEAGRQTLEHLRDPIKYASEDPAGFSLDLLGLYGGARGLMSYADDAARYAGYSGRGDWLNSEVGALGPQGRALEAMPDNAPVRLKPDFAPGQYARQQPRPVIHEGERKWFRPEDGGLGGAREEVLGNRTAQSLGYGDQVPGVAYVNDRHLGEGALIEDIPDFAEIQSIDELRSLRGVDEAARRQAIIDIANGNVDRGWKPEGTGHNQWRSGDRLVTGDANVSWPSGRSNFTMRQYFDPFGDAGSALTDVEKAAIRQAMDDLSTPRFALASEDQLAATARRLQTMLDDGVMPYKDFGADFKRHRRLYKDIFE